MPKHKCKRDEKKLPGLYPLSTKRFLDSTSDSEEEDDGWRTLENKLLSLLEWCNTNPRFKSKVDYYYVGRKFLAKNTSERTITFVYRTQGRQQGVTERDEYTISNEKDLKELVNRWKRFLEETYTPETESLTSATSSETEQPHTSTTNPPVKH